MHNQDVERNVTTFSVLSLLYAKGKQKLVLRVTVLI